MRRVLIFIVVLAVARFADAQGHVERNIVYGMYSGTALLMDVHYPDHPNGIGVVAIPGSGWTSALGYDAKALKDNAIYPPLANAGYTVFLINHRQAPAFQYPAAIEDAQRAVRFIRFSAAKFGINPNEIGAIGASSGGHLVSLLGVLDGKGGSDDHDPINRLSSKVQSVVTISAPFDLRGVATPLGSAFLGLFLGVQPFANTFPKDGLEYRRYVAASPVTYVTPDDPPFLEFHGDADQIVPVDQSRLMEKALKDAGVGVSVTIVSGGGHGANFLLPAGDPRAPDVITAAAKWFDKYLRKSTN